MLKRMAGLLVVVLLVFCVPAAVPQQQEQAVYTFVSQWQVPRANWAQFAEDTEKALNPILQRRLDDGTIIAWGNFETIVHSAEGDTHIVTWQATSLAGITRVFDELVKAGPRPGQITAVKHEDLLLRSVLRHSTPVANGSGYARVVGALAQPGKEDDYVALLKKHIIPVLEDQFKKGNITFYAVEQQYVVSGPGSLRSVVTFYPNAEAMDKAAAAINAHLDGMTPAERSMWQGGLASTTIPNSRRDILARATHYSQK
jgi:hypothetical protein